MPKYLGPFDTLQFTEDGPVFRIGDNVPQSLATKEWLEKNKRHYLFEGLDQPPASPSGPVTPNPADANPPNELGVPEEPARPKKS
jgi:hypothetical protein